MKVSAAAIGLKRLRERAKMSVREMAEALRKPPSTYASYEDKFKKPYLPLDLAHALVPILVPKGIAEAEILTLAGLKGAHFLSESSTKGREEPLTAPDINIQHFPRDVPILGSGACGEDGLFELNGQIHGFAKRPPRLLGVKDAYAVYIQGESMVPWRKPGQMVYVDPYQPPQIGDFVVVQLKPAGEGQPVPAYIKQLLRRTAKELRLHQFRPEEDLNIPTLKVHAVHRVIDWDELLGL